MRLELTMMTCRLSPLKSPSGFNFVFGVAVAVVVVQVPIAITVHQNPSAQKRNKE